MKKPLAKNPMARTVTKHAQGVTHSEIERAIATFRARGGLIHKLPDEIVLTGASVQSSQQWELAVVQAGDIPAASQPDAA
ncbi:MAG TPA: hypothetical protein VF678_11640 [bacterium]